MLTPKVPRNEVLGTSRERLPRPIVASSQLQTGLWDDNRGHPMNTTTHHRAGEVLNANFFRAQAQTCRIELAHTPLRERRYELQARADLYEDLASRLDKIRP